MNKIYTKTGDKGTTGLANGERVKKNSERIEAYGTVDELNSLLGICIQHMDNLLHKPNLKVQEWCFAIQNDLFNLGSDLATPIDSRWKNMILISNTEILQLEKMVDACQHEIPKLCEFILPGGTQLSSYLQLARTVCRRAERKIVTLSQQCEINDCTVKYINRLSDFLFVLARYIQREEKSSEIVWQKDGGTRFLKI